MACAHAPASPSLRAAHARVSLVASARAPPSVRFAHARGTPVSTCAEAPLWVLCAVLAATAFADPTWVVRATALAPPRTAQIGGWAAAHQRSYGLLRSTQTGT